MRAVEVGVGGVRGGGGCGGPAIRPLSSGKRQGEIEREEERRVEKAEQAWPLFGSADVVVRESDVR